MHHANTYTATTSWSGEKAFTAAQDITDFKGRIGALPTPAALQQQARQAATMPTDLPDDTNLTRESSARILSAVQKGITTLSYTVTNEVGRLDLNYLKPHLADLSPTEQQLAIHAVVQSLAQPQFSGLSGAITTLRLPALRNPKPNDLSLSLETLDLLNSDAFPNLELGTFAVQDAAIEGNLSFLRYAVEKGLLTDLNQKASQLIDAGLITNTMLQSLPYVRGGAGSVSQHFDIVQAAIMGGDRNAINYLSSLNAFRNYTSLDAAIEIAAKYGQIDIVLALGEANNRPASIEAAIKAAPADMGIEILQRYQAKFPGSSDLDRASPLLIEKAIRYGDEKATRDGDFDLLDKMLRQPGVSITHADNNQRNTMLSALSIKVSKASEEKGNKDILKAVRALDKTETLENDLLLRAAASNDTAFISVKLNETRDPIKPYGAHIVPYGTHDDEAALSVAHLKFPDSEAGKDDYKGVKAKTLTIDQARKLIQKALVYSHDRLRTDSTGASGRVNGWRNGMVQKWTFLGNTRTTN